MTSLSAHVAQALAPHVSRAFGVMGNGNAHFLDALLDTRVMFTAVRHETGAVAAADGYYRACGELAIGTTTYGAGFTNTVTALAESVRARIPLVLVVGDAPTTGQRGWDVDQVALAAAVGAPTFRVGHADAAEATARAVEHALAHRIPVVLAIPHDLAATDAPDTPRASAASTPSAPTLDRAVLGAVAPVTADDAALRTAAHALATAERPLIIAGRGAWLASAGPELTGLAERLGALTATSALGVGLFGESEFDLGIAGGFGSEAAAAVMHEADVVLVAGASLNQFTMRFGDLLNPAATVLQIDTEAAAPHPAVTGFLHGDVAAIAERLLVHLDDMPPAASTWRSRIGAVPLGRAIEATVGDGLVWDGRLDPRSVALRLDGLLPEDRTVVQDGGHFIGWAPSYWRIPSPDRLVMVGTAFQSIGLGFPSAVGVAVAVPESTIVLCTGDGGGLMALPDLESFIRTARSGIVVVFNDASYGAEVHQYGSKGLNTEPMLIDQIDFAGIARSFGGQAVTVHTLSDLDALTEWIDGGAEGVILLDCIISSTVVAPFMAEMVAVASR
ncbi:thiamine pyrophosphate-binding protein [Plantibacter sp. YIM 135347]|uniref:thiamine pyrophosphate-binding protein n=1 Tax=Plantibacter sp. YIM 135347 TaxID=3423919 RepID=UPI003D34525B